VNRLVTGPVRPSATTALWATATLLLALPGLVRAEPAPGDVDLANSRAYVLVGKTGLGHEHAVIGRLSAGHAHLGAAAQAGTLVFDMRTFQADTTPARKALGLPGETDPDTQRQVNENMLGPAILDVARHPTATLTIESALPARRDPLGPRPAYELQGAFTLHGVTRRVTIPVEVEQAGQIVRLSGGFTIRQTDFGITPFKKFGGVVGVADELRIHGDIRLVAGAAPATPAVRGPAP
jgi:hypothetical protein